MSFHGACIDTGAQRALIGEEHPIEYFKMNNLPFELTSNSMMISFKFGNKIHPGVGEIKIRIPAVQVYFSSCLSLFWT